MRDKIVKFYNDPDFQRLNSYYNRTTFFNIMNIERRELSHSAFLKWIFDINGSHNLNDEPLKKLLRMLANQNSNNSLYKDILNILLIGDYKIQNFHIEAEKSVKIDKKGRIDIFAEFEIFKKNDGSSINSEEKKLNKKIVLIIENKVEASESNNQTIIYDDWAKKEYEGHTPPILIFLNPNEEDCSSNNFITISYQDILEYVIEPLLSMEMNVNTKIILEDYIVNLGQPKKQIKENGKETGLESILAVSKKNKDTFSNLLKKYEDLLNASLVAYYKRKDELNNIFADNLNTIRKDIKGNESLLYSFWETNKTLLRIIYLYGKENEDGMIENLKKLFKIKASTRDNVKYIVLNNDGTLINETDSKGNIKTVPKSIASFYIFKAWAKQNPDATLDDIRKAFPVSECAKHYEKVYQYLFYEYNEHDKNARIIYTDDKEEFPERAYIEWDFYKGDLAEIYHLNLNGVKVMTQKFWSKRKVGDGISDDFKILADYAEEHYGIKVEEQT